MKGTATMFRERCLDYLLGDRVLATVHLAPTGNVDADGADPTVRILYRDVFTGRRLVSVAGEAKLRALRRAGGPADEDASTPQVEFEDFAGALDDEARTVQNLLRCPEDLPEHAPGRITREMARRVRKIDLAPID